MRLSVLDQSPISEGSTGAEALRNTIDLAQLADGLGYHRYWVAEHHGGPMLAGPSPEALIGPIAAATERIRVGSGGVMLPHYSPFKVAETFSRARRPVPGDRIDLGIGRAAGTDPMTTRALQRDRSPARCPTTSPSSSPSCSPTSTARSRPATRSRGSPSSRALPERPTPWLLGSSPQSAIWAGELGLPYAFADFINPAGAEIAALYRRHFAEGRERGASRTVVAVWALAADTDEEAQRLASSAQMAMAMLRRGRLIEVPPRGDGAALPRLRGGAGPAAAAHDRRHARDRPRRPRDGRLRLRRRGGRSWSPSPTTTPPGGAPTS